MKELKVIPTGTNWLYIGRFHATTGQVQKVSDFLRSMNCATHTIPCGEDCEQLFARQLTISEKPEDVRVPVARPSEPI